jgi:imidazolonepropionase-like amidohydrolase
MLAGAGYLTTENTEEHRGDYPSPMASTDQFLKLLALPPWTSASSVVKNAEPLPITRPARLAESRAPGSFGPHTTPRPRMSLRILASILVAVAAAAELPGQQATPRAAPQATALVGATLLNPGAAPVRDAVVVIRGERIACAGQRSACPVPAGARTIDVRGAWIAPGLVDAHVHYSQTGWVDGRPDALDVREEMPYEATVGTLKAEPGRFHRAWLCSGVTSVYDVGGYTWTYDLARATRSATDAPRVVAAGPLLSTIDHWVNLPNMRQFLYMRDDSLVRAMVRAQAATGAEAIKVWYIDLPDSLRARKRPLLELAGAEAARAKLPLIVHATELRTAKEALAAGARTLVHSVESDTIDEEFVALAKRNGTIVIPTLTVLEGYGDVYLGQSPAARYPLACVDAATRAKLERVIPESRREREAAWFRRGGWRQQRRTMEENVRRMKAAGIPIAMGTDAGNPGTAHGPSVYREMEALQQAGLTAAEALASATIVAARAAGIADETGSIAAGKRADLVVLDADPTADIANARRVRLVVRNGRVHRHAELLPAP